MKKISLLIALLVATACACPAQQRPSAIRIDVAALNGMPYADSFAGSTPALQIQNAIADCAPGACTVVIPADVGGTAGNFVGVTLLNSLVRIIDYRQGQINYGYKDPLGSDVLTLGGLAFNTIGASGTCITSNGTVASWGACAAGGGTVTSVGVALPSAFTVTGSPVTTSGTLTGAFNVAAADYLLTATGANAAAWEQINAGAACGDSTHALSYSISTHTFGCQAITGSAAAGGSTTQVQYNNATALGGEANSTYNNVTGTSTINQLANGDDVLDGARFTDTLPAGNLINLTEADGVTPVFRVTAAGNVSWLGNQFLNGSPTQLAPSAFYNYAAPGVSADYEAFSAGLPNPVPPVGTAGSGGSLAATTYNFQQWLLNGPGSVYTTGASLPADAVVVAASGIVTMTLPSSIAGANELQLSINSVGQGTTGLCGTYNYTTAAWTSGPACTATISGLNLTITAYANSTLTIPTVNTTQNNLSGHILMSDQSSNFCETSLAPSQTCPAASWLMTNPMVAAGDIFYGGTVNVDDFAPPVDLPIGTVGQCLGVATSTTLGWQSCGSSLTAGTNISISTGVISTVTNPTFTGTVIANDYSISTAGVQVDTGVAGVAHPGVFGGITTLNTATAPGSMTFQSSSNSGTGGTGSVIISPGVSSGTGAAGNASIEAGGNSSTGNQGIVQIVETFVKGATVTANNLESISADMTVADSAANATNIIGVATGTVTSTPIEVVVTGEALINSTASAAVNNYACTGATAGEITPSATACSVLSQTVGMVISITEKGASATLPLVQLHISD